jgi:hypothetical protein
MATIVKEKKKSKKLYFTTTGEFITRTAREMWVSDLPKKALNILYECGMSKEQALLTISGKKQLVGKVRIGNSDTLDWVDDNVTEMHGIALDVETMIDRLERKYIELSESKIIYSEADARTYGDDEQEDEEYREKLIENVEPKIHEAVEGLEVLYPVVGKTMKDLPVRKVRSFRKIKDDLRKEEIAQQERQNEIAKKEKRTEKFTVGGYGGHYYVVHTPVEKCEKENLTSGFLLPDGTFFGGSGVAWVHRAMIETLSDYGFFKDKEYVADEDDCQKIGGWIKISSGHGWLLYGTKKPTNEQIQFIIDYTMTVDKHDYVDTGGFRNIPLKRFASLLDGAKWDIYELTKDEE